MFGFKISRNLTFFSITALAVVATLWLAPRRPPKIIVPGHATMPDSAEEKAKNAQCVKEVCSILLTKEANGPDVTCDLAHRWQSKEIQGLAEAKDVSWSMGPARCSVKVSAKRADPA